MINNIIKLHDINHKLRYIQRSFKYLPKHMFDDLDEVLTDYQYLCKLSYYLTKKGVNVDEV